MLDLVLTLSTFSILSAVPLYPYKTQVELNDLNRVSINWRSSDVQERVYFAVEWSIESDARWFAFGFSDQGDYRGSDLCVWNGMTLIDSHVDSRGSIRPDADQNCHLDNVDRYPDGRITLFFWREYDTCDKDDYVIEDGTTQLVVAVGKTQRMNVLGDHVLKAIKPTRLIHTVPPPAVHTEDVELVDITSRNVTIPPKETTYWCTVVRIPPMDEKRHIIKYEAVIDKGNEHHVHHMEVYHCEAQSGQARRGFPLYSGECRSPAVPSSVKTCRRVVGAWAMGAPPMVYPPQAGFPIGGPGYFPFVMVEIHYNNPMKRSGVVDNSGIRFHVTPRLRQFDAGVMEVGLEYTDRMAVPPRQRAFPLTGYCTPECTDALLPDRGVTIFASQLHSHLIGRRLSTWHVREGEQLAVVNSDRHYSPHWQEIRPVQPVRMLPGDSLITTCVYDTSARGNVTLGGYGIKDEMCVNYIHYYPKTKLEVCKSAIDASALQSFFTYINEREGRRGPRVTPAEQYEAIRWTGRMVSTLQRLYHSAPIRAECRRNDGQLINLPSRKPVPVLYPLKKEPSRCDRSIL